MRPSAVPSRSNPGSRMWIALLMLLLAPSGVQGAGVREARPNLVGGEIGGRGFILTLNYERYLADPFGLGGGIMAVGGSGGGVAILPFYASFLSGDEHSLYVSAGASLVIGSGGIGDYRSQWIVHTSLGYHYHSRGGFFVRPIFTIHQGTSGTGDDLLVLPGITIGGSF